jgi:hypothetical protein
VWFAFPQRRGARREGVSLLCSKTPQKEEKGAWSSVFDEELSTIKKGGDANHTRQLSSLKERRKFMLRK